MDSKNQARINGYAVNDDGLIEPCRGGPVTHMTTGALRFKHTHLGIISLQLTESKNAKALIDAVLAAVDEPAALVGIGKAGAVMVFRIDGDNYNFWAREGYMSPKPVHEFVLDNALAQFTATAEAEPFDIAVYTWRNDRSPLNTPLYSLPPIHADIAQAAFDALTTVNGARLGPLVLPETDLERALRRAAERRAAGIVDAPETEEQKDAALVAANPHLKPSDGTIGLHVAQARTRIAQREQVKLEEKQRQDAEAKKAKMKAQQARLGNPT